VLVPRPLVVEPVMDWYLPRSASLRLGVGRPLPASAGGLFFAWASWLCVADSLSAGGLPPAFPAPRESSAVLPDAPALLRRNTRIA
jgi:hypothetical protein